MQIKLWQFSEKVRIKQTSCVDLLKHKKAFDNHKTHCSYTTQHFLEEEHTFEVLSKLFGNP